MASQYSKLKLIISIQSKMKIKHSNQVVNTNCQNFLHNCPHGKDVFQIQPDKFTFLKSNLLVSNIVNKSTCKEKKLCENNQLDTTDAYINCQVEIQKLQEQNEVKSAQLQRVKNLIKCKSQMTLKQLAQQEKNIHQKIQNVHILRKEMDQKAAQIMSRKEDNSYLGRNLQKDKQSLLRELKEKNPREKIQKSETIRLLMKDSAKKCNRKQLKQILQDSANASLTKETLNGSLLDSSMDLSLLNASNINAMEKRVHTDEVLKKLMKCKSTQAFMQQQKRKAVWDGFSQHWRKGDEKHQEKLKALKKKVPKKSLKPKFETSDHEILNYHDQYTRFIALKKFENAFAETSSSFKLRID